MKLIELLRYYNESEKVLVRYCDFKDNERKCFEGNFYEIREFNIDLLQMEVKYFSIYQLPTENYTILNIVLKGY